MVLAGMNVQRVREALGRVGVWLFGAAIDSGAEELAGRIESLGYGAVWIGGGNTKASAFERLERLLSATNRLVVATGITSIWAWQPDALLGEARSLELGHAGRFVLGLGVSHEHLVEHLGKHYERPYSAMVAFLDGLEAAADGQGGVPPLVLAALGDRMLELSRDRSVGAHPYFVPVEHTAHARSVLGPEPVLATELAVVLEGDPAKARRAARAYMEHYIGLPNYASNLRRFGYVDADFDAGGSDRLVDAVVAWGSTDDVAKRVQAHLDAGADHVCIQPLAVGGGLDVAALDALAPLVTGQR